MRRPGNSACLLACTRVLRWHAHWNSMSPEPLGHMKMVSYPVFDLVAEPVFSGFRPHYLLYRDFYLLLLEKTRYALRTPFQPRSSKRKPWYQNR